MKIVRDKLTNAMSSNELLLEKII